MAKRGIGMSKEYIVWFRDGTKGGCYTTTDRPTILDAISFCCREKGQILDDVLQVRRVDKG